MKPFLSIALLLAVATTAGPALAQSAKAHTPISSTVTANVVVEESEAIKDLPDKHIRWIPPVHEFKNRNETFIDLVKGLPASQLQVGCAGAFADYANQNQPAQKTPKKVRVTVVRGTENGDKKFAKVKADVVKLNGIWVALVQKTIPGDTTYFDFWIEHLGGGTTSPNLLMGYNCGVFAVDPTVSPAIQ